MNRLSALLRPWLPEAVLLASMALFVVLARPLAEAMPVWHEVTSALPNNASSALAWDPSVPGGAVRDAPTCATAGPPRVLVSEIRPQLRFCLAGRELPVMISAYASGLATWPLALAGWPLHFDTFAVRRVWLFVAALSMLLTFRLVGRFAGRSTAALVAVSTAASSPFLLVNALLLPYETLPCTLVVAALTLVASPSSHGPDAPSLANLPAGRLVPAALLVGLALASNVKALVFVAPLAALAWRVGHRPSDLPPRTRRLALAALVAPWLPTLLFAFVDPRHGLSQQFMDRTGWMLENLRPSRFASEALLLFNFAADLLSYMDGAARRGSFVQVTWVTVAMAVPLVHCMISAVSWLAGRRHGSVVSAAAGSVIVAFYLLSALFYRQYPGGNYAPLHDVFGIAVGAGVADLGRAVGARVGGEGRGRIAAVLVVCMLAAGSLTNVARRSLGEVRLSTNTVAARAAVAELVRASEADGPVLTTTYNLAGTFEALGHGRIPALQVHTVLEACREVQGDPGPCLRERWRRILDHVAGTSVRIAAPVQAGAVDGDPAFFDRIQAAMTEAAAERGWRAAEEKRFKTREGVPVLRVIALERSR